MAKISVNGNDIAFEPGATILLPAMSVTRRRGERQGLSGKSPANGTLLSQRRAFRDD